jgi:ribosomal protein S19E (S16A)
MNASMARRIRCAESLLIYAIDRQYGEQRDRSQAAQPQTHAIRFPVVDQNGDRTGGNLKQDTRSESCAA